MESFIPLLISGVSLGSLYAIIALGFVIIYRGSQVLNFAHGEFLTFGAMTLITLHEIGIPWFTAFPLTLVFTGILAVLIERGILRRLVGRPVFVTIIMTLLIGLVLRVFIILFWGVEPRGMPTPWETTADANIFGVSILINNLGGIIAASICLLTFFIIQRYTRLGAAMRASSADQEAALALGVPVGKIFAITWFISGAFAAAGGVFLGMFPSTTDANLGFIAFRAFPAVIVGGLESPSGAVVAGLSLGILEVMTQRFINPYLGAFGHDFHVVFPYLVMILFLAIRPYGIFGQEEVKRA